jgi:hypothetical protein
VLVNEVLTACKQNTTSRKGITRLATLDVEQDEEK